MGENENKHPLASDRTLAAALVDLYGRLMDAQSRIADLREHRHLSLAQVAEGLAGSELDAAEIEEADELDLTTLARYIHALGGHLELRAVFPDETVPLLEPPAEPA